jgi:hypothetical protein
MSSKNSWKWLSGSPKIGVDMIAIPGIFFPFVLLSFVTQYARYGLVFLIGVYSLSAVLRCKPKRLIKRLRVSKSKTATPIWRKKVVMSLLAGFVFSQPLMSDTARAEFRVIGVKQMMAEQESRYEEANTIERKYDVKGVGRDVHLNKLLSSVLTAPWGVRFLSDELKDISISWAAPDGITERALIADISRRYGLSFMASESEFLYYVDWDVDGVCDESHNTAIKEAELVDKNNVGVDVPARRPVHTGRDKIQSQRYVC